MEDITLNFGVLKESINRKATAEIYRTDKSETLKEFTKRLRKSPILQKQYLVYKNFEECKPFTKERLAERFIGQNLNIMKNSWSWRQIVAENKNLQETLLKEFHVESGQDFKGTLYEHINTLIEGVTNPNFSNWEKEQESYEYLLEYLTREAEEKSEEITDHPNLTNWKVVTKMAVNNFNKRYSHLNEDEKKVFHILISDNDKKRNYVEDLRQETLKNVVSAINECQDDEKLKLLEQFRNKLEGSTNIEPTKLDEHLLSFIELQQTLEEEK